MLFVEQVVRRLAPATVVLVAWRYLLRRGSLILPIRLRAVGSVLLTAVAACAGRSHVGTESRGCVSGAAASGVGVDGSAGFADSGAQSVDVSHEDSALGDGRFQNPSGWQDGLRMAQMGAAIRALNQCVNFVDGQHDEDPHRGQWPDITRGGVPRWRPSEPISGWVPLRSPRGARCIPWFFSFNNINPLARFVVDGLRCDEHEYSLILQGSVRATQRGVDFELDTIDVRFDGVDQFEKGRSFLAVLPMRWARNRYRVTGTFAVRLTPWVTISMRDLVETQSACDAGISSLRAIPQEELVNPQHGQVR